MTTDIVIYRNPECGTSLNALSMIHDVEIGPLVEVTNLIRSSTWHSGSVGAGFQAACRRG